MIQLSPYTPNHSSSLPQQIQQTIIGHLKQPRLTLCLVGTEEADRKHIGTPGIFHPRELEKARHFSLQKRRREYLGGRLAARILLAARLTDRFHPDFSRVAGIFVTNDKEGRPWFQGETTGIQLPNLSIAHSGDFALAATSSPPVLCGVDIQKASATLVKIKDKFTTPKEVQLVCAQRESSPATFHQSLERQSLNILWSAKESLRKLLGHWQIPGFLELQLFNVAKIEHDCLKLHFTWDPPQKTNIGRTFPESPFVVISWCLEDRKEYCLAVTAIPQPETNHA